MSESSKQLLALVMEYTQESLDNWLQHSVFKWQWWLGVFIAIVPWIVWIFIRDKKSTNRLLYVGFFAMIFAFTLDTIGITFGLWFYQYRTFPVIHIFFPWDFTLIPLSIMILLQIKPHSYLLIKTLFFAAFSAYIAEPIFHWLDIFYPVNWKYTYSFILYIILYLICDFLSNRKSFEP